MVIQCCVYEKKKHLLGLLYSYITNEDNIQYFMSSNFRIYKKKKIIETPNIENNCDNIREHLTAM